MRLLSRYEVLEEIGRGNMGVVYKANDPAINRTVAVKIVRLGFSLDDERRAAFIERFRREAQIVGRLTHPNIVAVHDVGVGDEPFIVMEYFQGRSLSRLLGTDEFRSFDLEQIRHITRQVASALGYAHEVGVVHRDVKPANILYAPGPLIKLVDFGIAKIEAPELTATGEVIGTPSYMSPELFSGVPVDGRSDLFSLGVILYQLLTGVNPFDSAAVSRTIYRVLHEVPEPPSSIRPGLPSDWDYVCSRLLAKDPANRYPSAERLSEDLDALGRGELERVELPPADVPTAPIAMGRRSVWSRSVPFAIAVVLVALVSRRSGIEREDSGAGGSAAAATAAATAAGLDTETTPDSAEAVPEAPSLKFVARHEHRLGYCTGDLYLGGSGVVFETSRHGRWKWRPDEIEGLHRVAGDELEIDALSRERGKRDELTHYRFTFLRPAIGAEDAHRYDEWLRSVRK
jgi:hypothetical protein